MKREEFYTFILKGLGILFIFVLGYIAEVGRKYPNWTEGERVLFTTGVILELSVVFAMMVFIFKLWRKVE